MSKVALPIRLEMTPDRHIWQATLVLPPELARDNLAGSGLSIPQALRDLADNFESHALNREHVIVCNAAEEWNRRTV